MKIKINNKSIGWYFNDISCNFTEEEEIADIMYKTTGKRLVKILLSEIDKFRLSSKDSKEEFGEELFVYHLNLQLKEIRITKDCNNHRKHIYNFEFYNIDNLEEVYYIDLNFLDYLYFQDIKDSDFN